MYISAVLYVLVLRHTYGTQVRDKSVERNRRYLIKGRRSEGCTWIINEVRKNYLTLG